MKVSIVIPYFNKWELTHQSLMSIYKYVQYQETEIVLVNDCSPENDCKDGAEWWQNFNKRQPIRYFMNSTNRGFGVSSNHGAKIAINHNADVVVILNNDVQISGDFVLEIVNIIEKNDAKVFIGGEVIDWPGGWNEIETLEGKVVVPYANGWLIACTKDVWEDIGGFDKRYGRYDFEDVDISTKALSLGYNIVALKSNYLKHLGGVTIASLNVDRLEHTKKNREIYIQKWFNQLSMIQNGKLLVRA